MGLASDFYYGNYGNYGRVTADYSRRGFVLPDGQYKTAKNNQVHPDLAEEIIKGSKLYSDAFEQMQQKLEYGYYYFLLALGCIATDSVEDQAAIIPRNALIRNTAETDIREYNRNRNRIVKDVTIEETYIEQLNCIWKNLTKGKNEPDGR